MYNGSDKSASNIIIWDRYEFARGMGSGENKESTSNSDQPSLQERLPLSWDKHIWVVWRPDYRTTRVPGRARYNTAIMEERVVNRDASNYAGME